LILRFIAIVQIDYENCIQSGIPVACKSYARDGYAQIGVAILG
jgi:hypothetical protein